VVTMQSVHENWIVNDSGRGGLVLEMKNKRNRVVESVMRGLSKDRSSVRIMNRNINRKSNLPLINEKRNSGHR